MTALSIARLSLRRLARDRTALFFMVVLPIVIILIIGFTVRGFQTFRVGVVDLGAGRSGAEVVSALRHGSDLVVLDYKSVSAVRTAVARSEVATAVILPAGMDDALRAGRTVGIDVLAEQTNSAQQAAAAAVTAVVDQVGARVQAAVFAASHGAAGYDAALASATAIQPHLAQVRVADNRVGGTPTILPEGFSYSSPTMLVLFVFISSLTAGSFIIEARRLGMYERMGAAPVRRSTIVAGETLTMFAIALGQAGLIILVGAIVFGVSWGNPLAAFVLTVTWVLVGSGAGMLAGTLFRTSEQASALGPTIGMATGMLGGCMWPLAIVSSTMRQFGHVTPHAWAVDAWTSLLAAHGTLRTIAPDLGVLAAFAVVLLVAATLRMQKVVASRPS